MMDQFAASRIDTGETTIFVRTLGSGPPVLLLHGFLTAAAEAVVDAALGGWGTPHDVFPAEVRAEYVRALQDPAHAHAICEEYRAAAGVDREHDESDRAAGHRIRCPLLALWSAGGVLARARVGPIESWRAWADNVRGHALEAGHFFPEEMPEETAVALAGFFGGDK